MPANKLSPVWEKEKAAKRYDELPKEKVSLKKELTGLKPESKQPKQNYGFGGNP